MNSNLILASLWAVLNSPVGVSLVASAALWLINKLYTVKPAWQAYEGAIINAVQWAEKEIPDNSDNKHIQRANLALQYTLAAYERLNGHRASQRMEEELKQGVEIVHTDLEAAGVL
jgi:hypothetical protein